ncbi:hypothetical protein JW964_14315 [candidate division KSB1 bacterium]|nr:hypothetical protein [candidate division KSB1 bacterium]
MKLKRIYILPLFMLAIFILLPLFHTKSFAKNHRDIWLKDESGHKILPDRNSTEPYSPRRTCGTCHGYSRITFGYHFQQGFTQISDNYDPLKPWIVSPGMYGKW